VEPAELLRRPRRHRLDTLSGVLLSQRDYAVLAGIDRPQIPAARAASRWPWRGAPTSGLPVVSLHETVFKALMGAATALVSISSAPPASSDVRRRAWKKLSLHPRIARVVVTTASLNPPVTYPRPRRGGILPPVETQLSVPALR
jgi:hypothetical protein